MESIELRSLLKIKRVHRTHRLGLGHDQNDSVGRAIDAYELACQFALPFYREMDPTGQFGEIRVETANNDAGVIRGILMQANEVLAIERDQGAAGIAREPQHGLIGDGLPCIASILDCQDVVAQSPKFFGDRDREDLVRVQTGHRYATSLSRMC